MRPRIERRPVAAGRRSAHDPLLPGYPLSSCSRSQSSTHVLANGAGSCSDYLLMGRRSCSH